MTNVAPPNVFNEIHLKQRQPQKATERRPRFSCWSWNHRACWCCAWTWCESRWWTDYGRAHRQNHQHLLLPSSAPKATQKDSQSWNRCSACVGLCYQQSGLLQLGLRGSTQVINNAATTSTERLRQTNQATWSVRQHLVDNSWPSLAPSEVPDNIHAVSDDACSQQPSMSWIHCRAAHRDISCYFTLQTAIDFQQSLQSSSNSTKVWR